MEIIFLIINLCHINTIIVEGYADAEKLVVLIGKLIKSYKR